MNAKFFLRIFNKNLSRAKKESETLHGENKKDSGLPQATPGIEELLETAIKCDYEGVFEMLENGLDPNLLLDRDDNRRILDRVRDESMVKLLRAYGAKSTEEVVLEEEKKLKEKQEHERQRRERLVDDLLKKRKSKVGG